MTLREVQQAYFAFYDEHLDAHLAATEHCSESELIAYIEQHTSAAALTVKAHGASLTPFEYTVMRFATDVTAFWAEHRMAVLSEISRLPGATFQIKSGEYHERLSEDVRRLAVYFDTVVVYDGIFFSPIQQDLSRPVTRQFAVSNFRRAAALNRLRSLSAIDHSPPLVVVASVPPDNGSEYAERNAVAFLNEVFGPDVAGMPLRDILNDYIPSQDGEQLLQRGLGHTVFRELHDTYSQMPGGHLLIDPQTGSVERRYGVVTDADPEQVVGALSRQVFRDLLEIDDHFLSAELTGADDGVGLRRWPMYKWAMCGLARDVSHAVHIDPETVIPFALQRPEMNFLRAIGEKDLLDLRQDQGLQEVRLAMHLERNRVRAGEMGNVPSAARDAARRLVEAIADVELQLARAARTKHARGAVAVGGVLVSGALGAASIVCPPLSVPATIVSVALGPASVREVVRQLRHGSEEERRILKRPLGILYQVHRRAIEA